MGKNQKDYKKSLLNKKLKRKIKITLGLIAIFLIIRNNGYGEDFNYSGETGLYLKGETKEVNGTNITIEGTVSYGLYAGDKSQITITGTEEIDITGKKGGLYLENSTGNIKGTNIAIKGIGIGEAGVDARSGTQITIIGSEKVDITGNALGLHFINKSEGNISGENIIIKGTEKHGLYIENESQITITGSEKVDIEGWWIGLYLKDNSTGKIEGENINIKGNTNSGVYLANSNGSILGKTIIIQGEKNNGAYIGGQGKTLKIEGKNVNILGETNGVKAENGATINITGDITTILSKKAGVYVQGGKIEITSDEAVILGETRGVHANSSGGKIDINSLNTIIKAQAENGVGLEASTGADLNINSINTIIFGKEYSIYADSENNNVKSEITLSENGSHEIYGNIKSSRNSSIKIGGKGNKISSSSNNEPLKVTAEDGGEIDISLVDGILTGIVDDGRAADANANGGTINLNLDNGTWKTQGKSFVTSIDLRNNGNIIFTEEGTSVDIKNLSGDGNGTFGMTVNAINKSEGNMLYVKESNGGIYNVALQNSNLEDIKIGERIRFATIGNNTKTNNLGFKVLDIKERGIRDINFKVEKEEFDKNDSENEIYNGGQTSNDKKPGNDYVVGNYQDGENWYLTRNSSGNINDIGTAIMEVAKSNYANAVYMDNLNKRLGDMSFADGESGLWVRMRNDKVGEDNHYKLHNYMTQIGYDKSYSMENGIEHRGIAFEYGKGDMKYKELKGNTDTDKYILTLYKTKVRDNKVYTDYTLRGGAISNDFTVYGRETGAKVTGKYKNMVLGAGTEVGKRYELDKNWYIEPQAQLQYTYINSTDYTTNQMTKVDLDEIHSLIGRAGIKLGHDSYKGNKKDNTVYVKADINHEFLGEQNVKAKDETGRLDKTYKNNETWVEIGIGASKKITPDLNVYADVEKQLGSNKDNKSWQVNVGFRYKF